MTARGSNASVNIADLMSFLIGMAATRLGRQGDARLQNLRRRSREWLTAARSGGGYDDQ
jgi:hypothetical protein